MANYHKLNIGVLGGGQLGKMLGQSASMMGLKLHMLDTSKDFPAHSANSSFTEGSFKDYDTVMAFAQDKDLVTVEIEAVNTQALHDLVSQGKKVYPQPHLLDLIKDKGLQKEFYKEKGLSTSPFELMEDAQAIKQAVVDGKLSIPFVQKARKDGYDGKGVHIVRHITDLSGLLDTASVIEPLVDIDRELAVIVARNENGDICSFPVVDMEFHPTANLVEYLFCPSAVSKTIQDKATVLAENIASKMEIVGLLAVELFLTKEGEILINEVAPRPHNSGHHTIEANDTSQYEQHLRAICNMPLGDTRLLTPAVMVNLLGDPEYTGDAHYQGMDECLAKSGVHMHLYGKATTKPYRKMGHATIIDKDLDEAIEKAKFVKNNLKIISQ